MSVDLILSVTSLVTTCHLSQIDLPLLHHTHTLSLSHMHSMNHHHQIYHRLYEATTESSTVRAGAASTDAQAAATAS
jgi:hypothetical protein